MLLEALRCKNFSGPPPVWLMRQAGRYMPSYRALREKYSLRELFFTPELAAKITLMPVEQIGVDAAILFSDITVVALSLGFSLDFAEGPCIEGMLDRRGIEPLLPIGEAIRLAKLQLKVPLIGFCGGPYTVASYMGGDPALLQPITEATLEYIDLQQEAGIDALQIFDSWANLLSKEEFGRFCLPYLKQLVRHARVPVILFMRNAALRLEELIEIGPDAISFDQHTSLPEIRKQIPIALQGNLDPDLLYEPFPVIRQKTEELLESMGQDPGFIVNLGHGVKPDMRLDAVKCLVETVQASGGFLSLETRYEH